MRIFSHLNTALVGIVGFTLPALFVACSNYAAHYKEEPMQAGTFRSRALLSEPQRRTYDSLFLEAQLEKHRGHLAAAEGLLNRALKVNPNASEALYEQARILLETQTLDASDRAEEEAALPDSGTNGNDSLRLAQGEQMLLKAHQLDPKNPFFRQALADHWVSTEKYARAARIYEEIVEETPSTENLGILLQLHARANQNTEALAVLDRLEAKNGVDQQSAVQRFNLLLASGDKAGAFTAFRQFSEEHPDDLMARLILSELYVLHNYKGLGYALFDDIEKSYPHHPLVAISKLQMLNNAENTQAFEQQLMVVMRHPEVEPRRKFQMLYQLSLEEIEGKRKPAGGLLPYYRAALAFPQPSTEMAEMAAFYVENAGLPTDSLEMPMRALLRDDPEHEKARIQLVLHELKKGHTEEVRQLCETGIEYLPEQILFYYFAGVAQTSMGEADLALQTLQRGVEKINSESDPELASDLHAALGDLLHQQGRTHEAFVQYDRALAFFPDNASCLNNYAYFLALEGRDLRKAVKMSGRAVELHPLDPTYLDTHAWVLFIQKRYREAKLFIDSAIEAIEAHGETAEHDGYYDHAGDIYFRCQQPKQAVALWQKALKLTEDNELATKLKKKIRYKRL